MHGDTNRVVVVNLSDQAAQFQLPLAMPQLAGQNWLLRDLLNDEDYVRTGDEMLGPGLSIFLPGHGFHLFDIQPA
jgi:hypothetical protein